MASRVKSEAFSSFKWKWIKTANLTNVVSLFYLIQIEGELAFFCFKMIGTIMIKGNTERNQWLVTVMLSSLKS